MGKAHPDKCYFFNLELRGLGSGCRFGDKCRRDHVRIPDKDFEPPRTGSQSPRRGRSPHSSDGDNKPARKGRDYGFAPSPFCWVVPARTLGVGQWSPVGVEDRLSHLPCVTLWAQATPAT